MLKSFLHSCKHISCLALNYVPYHSILRHCLTSVLSVLILSFFFLGSITFFLGLLPYPMGSVLFHLDSPLSFLGSFSFYMGSFFLFWVLPPFLWVLSRFSELSARLSGFCPLFPRLCPYLSCTVILSSVPFTGLYPLSRTPAPFYFALSLMALSRRRRVKQF